MEKFIEKLENKISENPVKCLFHWFLVPTGGVILVLAIIFIINFSGQHYSTNIADWGTFGDFLGGVLNPFISLISLMLIAFLTIYITGREGQRQFYLSKKVEAYGELMSYYSKLNFLKFSLFSKIVIIKKQEHDKKIHEYIRENKDMLIRDINTFDDFDTYLRVFDIKYSHIFDYDFKNHEYEKLKDECFGVNSVLETIKGHIEGGSTGFFIDLEFYEGFYLGLQVFVDRLKEEVDPKAGKTYPKLLPQSSDPNIKTVKPIRKVVFNKAKGDKI